MKKDKTEELLWIDKKKKIISCEETNKVLNENFSEIVSILQNSFDDAVLLGCDESDFKKKVEKLLKNVRFSIGKK
ncbi:MAG: hypothetical protein VX976_01765 [Pseudomonadota bacterium]|nr:hypothetical protein [Pseudomonadota bacterium]